MRVFCSVLCVLLAATPLAAQVPVFPVDTVQVEVGSRVSTTLPHWTRGVEVITNAEIRKLPARSIAEALEWSLGVDVMARSPAQADIAIRGSTYEQVLVLVDGVRMSDPQTGHFDLNLAVPLAQVERIEVLRGPASALYGSDAVGGVINVVTRRGGAPTTLVSAQTGTFGTRILSGAARLGNPVGWLDFGVDEHRSDGHRTGTDFMVRQWRVAVGTIAADRPLRAEFAYAERDFGADRFYANFPSYEETRTTLGSVRWSAPARASAGIDFGASYRRHEDDFILRRDDPAFYRNVHTSDQLSADVVGRASLGRGVRVAGGAEAVREGLESSNLGERSESRTAAFGEVALLEGGVALNAGVRGDWHERYGSFVAPSLSGAVWLAPQAKVRASIGRAFRAPTWTERYYEDPQNFGDPDLAPERGWSGEVGLDVETSPLKLGFAGWVRRTEELIDWTRSSGSTEPWRTRNIGEARFEGIEASASGWLLGTALTGTAEVIQFSANAGDGFDSKYALRPVTRSYSLAFVRALPLDLELSGRVRYGYRFGQGTSPARSCVEGATEGRTEVDGRVAYEWDRARLYFDVRNAADAFGCDIIAQPTAGRAFYLGASWGR